MQPLPDHGHAPVMPTETLFHLGLTSAPPGESQPEGCIPPAQPQFPRNRPLLFMDCTVGRAGHSALIAPLLPQDSTLLALDVDPDNLHYARQRLEALQLPIHIRTFHANFAEAADVLAAINPKSPPKLDALLADFGVSTNQLITKSHGLSFTADAPLDMRLDPRLRKSAADLVATLSEQELSRIFFDYAQERHARKIARKIVQTRIAEPLKTTAQLARLVRSVQPPPRHHDIDPATRTFQALRMAVNEELASIQDLLSALPDLLAPHARAVFISFHSGEDRLIKQAIRQWNHDGQARPLTRKPLEPSEAEQQSNPKSRSAKLRALQWSLSRAPE